MVQPDVIRLFCGMISLVPLSYAIRKIPKGTIRQAYSLITSLIIQYLVYEDYMHMIYVQHIIAFLIIKLTNKKRGPILTLQSMLFLSGYHIYEYVFNYGGWTMNASGLLMILVCKYSMLGYDLDDGQEKGELTQQRKKNRVIETIGIWDFLGYINFLPSSLLGPPIEYNDYKNYMNQEEVYKNIPNVFKIVGITFMETILFLALYMIGDSYAPLNILRNPEFYENELGYIFLYANVSVYLLRCKYYFGWKMSMTAVHASGISYDGASFHKINTINPWVFQTSIHAREKVNNWNIGVQDWLRKCIYERSPVKNKSLNQLYVFLVSAFWHGFYSAYYISFTLWFLQLHLQTLMFKYFKSGKPLLARLYNKSGKIGEIVLSIIVMLSFSHSATYFLVLESSAGWMFMKRMCFIPQIGLVLMTIIFTLLPSEKSKKTDKTIKDK